MKKQVQILCALTFNDNIKTGGRRKKYNSAYSLESYYDVADGFFSNKCTLNKGIYGFKAYSGALVEN